jgi:class 3 adenylate cyclase/tetratricopeptide (TPR) repeat protein
MSESVLAPFVPALLAARLARRGRRAAGPDGWRTNAAVLVIDITGFTTLTERLAAGGPGGAETLAAALNASFGDAIGRILAHGGDVSSFAGDAILAMWPDGCPRCIRHAAEAALEAQADLERRRPTEDVRIRARAGVAAGDLWVGIVGGHEGAWRWVVGGLPFRAAAAGAALGEPGQLVATLDAATAADLGSNRLEHDPRYVRVDVVPADDDAPEPGGARGSELDPRPPADRRLAPFLPGEIVDRLASGGSGWLAEFRRLTVVFVGIGGLDAGSAGALQLAQPAFRAIQELISRYEGSLLQIVDDDKGLTVLAGWGLPDRAHEDDAARGVLAGSAIREALRGFGLTARVGVTTGIGFTGIRGSPERCEYAMVGDVVNLAARLMASSDDEVRIDRATARSAERRLSAAGVGFVDLGALVLKGKADRVAALRVEPVTGAGAKVRPAARSGDMIGRHAEWARVLDRLERLRSGAGGVLVIEGEPGVGKSELVRGLLGSITPPVTGHLGEADAIERATPYFVWRRPLADLLDADPGDGPALERALLDRLAPTPELRDRASFLGAILPIELPVRDALAALEADVRADAIRDLVVAVAGDASRLQPRALVLEDVHWADSSSWALMLAVARRVPGVLLVLSTRPMGADAPVELERLLAEPGAERILLGPLPIEATDELVRRSLRVSALPDGVATFIERRAEGNPFFSEQLAFALRDAGHLVVEGERARLARGVRDLDELDLPDSIHGVLASRIDRLSGSEQLTLKVASVIGRLFRVEILEDVHPIGLPRPELAHALDHASGLELTRLEAPDPDLAYLFTHVITQEVAYELLVFAQRRPLHRAVAEWYEANVGDLEPLVPLLAHHWGRAGNVDRTLGYLGRAGRQALDNYANAEALGFLREALRLDDANDRPTPSRVRADWERWTGIALVKSARYREALPHFEACLALLGAPNPTNPVRRVLSIQRHVLVQAGHRVRVRRMPASERSRALAISECHRYLAEVSYWRNDLFRMVHAMLASLNHAEPAGDSTELVFGLASVGFLFGLVHVHPFAARYRALTDAASDRVGNPDAAGYAAELEGVYRLVIGDWDGTRAVARRGIGIFRAIGDNLRWHTCHSHIGYADLHQGRFAPAAENAQEALVALGPEGLVQSRLWSLTALVASDLARDRVDPSVVVEAERLLGRDVHQADVVLVRGVMAAARARMGDEADAIAHARAVRPLVTRFPPPSFHCMLGIEGALEVLLAHWARTREPAIRREAVDLLGRLRAFARFNPAAGPRLALFEGRLDELEGRRDGARTRYRRAARLGSRLDMPYEVGLAGLATAELEPEGSTARASAARAALARLEPIEAWHDANRARALLEPPAATAAPTPAHAPAPTAPQTGELSDEPAAAGVE